MTAAFISYSWDNDDHKVWVHDLATRLHGEGITVKFDQWHLVPGDQLPQFMETAVRESDHVLVVCTRRYKVRSDNRTGGVGYEGDIMSAEVMNTRNQRKFIPILRSGTWNEAAPSWLAGKYYVDLSDNPYSEMNFNDLTSTLLSTRPKAPPVATKTTSAHTPAKSATVAPAALSTLAFEPLCITGVVLDDIGTPRNDGTRGSALYVVPFRLSRSPPTNWSQLFINAWNHPSQFTSMHRPGIASVHGDTIVLDGTTVEEVERYHRSTLRLAVNEANTKFSALESQRAQVAEAERQRVEEHRRSVSEAAKKLRFDDEADR